jgi:hypothetical protein
MSKKKIDFMAIMQDERFDKLDGTTALIIQKLNEAPSEVISALNTHTLEILRRQD